MTDPTPASNGTSPDPCVGSSMRVPTGPRLMRRLTVIAIAVVVIGLFLSVLVPTVSRLHELSKRLTCQSNMKAIATGLKLYAGDPSFSSRVTIDWLVQEGHITPDQMLCPSSGLTVSNYVLAQHLRPDLPADAVILYEPKSNHGGEGGNILFADGHASFVRGEEYDRLIENLPSPGP